MMQSPLTLTSLFERAGKIFPKVQILSQRPDDRSHRYVYADFYRRARALAAVLQEGGVRPGDRIATLMWNHYAHLECYFAVPAIGGVLHTLNLRLHPDELAYIVNHAEDRVLIVDDVLLPVFDQIKTKVKIDRVIVMPLGGTAAHGYEDYERLVETSSGKSRLRGSRGNRRGHDVLYVGHDRHPERGRLFPPCSGPAFLFDLIIHGNGLEAADFVAMRAAPSIRLDGSGDSLGAKLVWSPSSATYNFGSC